MLHFRHRWESRPHGLEVCIVPDCRRTRYVAWTCPRCRGSRSDHVIRTPMFGPEYLQCVLPPPDAALRAELREVQVQLHELRRAVWNMNAKLAQPAPAFDVDPEHGGVR